MQGREHDPDPADDAGVALTPELVDTAPAIPEPPPPDPTLAHLASLKRGPKWMHEEPTTDASVIRWEMACMLELTGTPVTTIAKVVGRSPYKIDRLLATHWARACKERLLPQIRERMLEQATDAAAQFQLAAPHMATVMLKAATEEVSPFRRALIAEKNLALAGIEPKSKGAQKGEKPEDDDPVKKLTDAQLIAFVERDEVPDELAKHYGIDRTPAEDAADD